MLLVSNNEEITCERWASGEVVGRENKASVGKFVVLFGIPIPGEKGLA